LFQSEISQDVPRQVLVDLAVSRDRLLLARLRVHIDIMVAPGAEQYAAVFFKPPKQFLPFNAIAT